MSEYLSGITNDEKESLQEKCGIVAIYNPSQTRQFDIALKASFGIQHRGLHGAGIAQEENLQPMVYSEKGHLIEVFSAAAIEEHNLRRETKWTLMHTRYGTSGDYSDRNIQPCLATAPDNSQIAVVHNGEFPATEVMRAMLQTTHPEGASDTYLFTELLAQNKSGSWFESLNETLKTINGAYSLVLGCEEGLMVARDPQGIRPLFLGKLDDGFIVASETSAILRIGARVVRAVSPGERILINEEGLHSKNEASRIQTAFCSLEQAYFSRPDSQFPKTVDDVDHPEKWLSYSYFRQRCGRILAEEVTIPNATFVVGIPDSGIPFASGYAAGAGLPILPNIMFERYAPNGRERTFMRDEDLTKIRERVTDKLVIISDREMWRDAVVILGDDSIIRGDVSMRITQAIKNLGAAEVHWVVGFPPINHTCHLGVSMRTREELIAVANDSDPAKIAAKIGAESVHYISPQSFLRASGIDINENAAGDIFLNNGNCGGCITGHYPVSRDGVINLHQV